MIDQAHTSPTTRRTFLRAALAAVAGAALLPALTASEAANAAPFAAPAFQVSPTTLAIAIDSDPQNLDPSTNLGFPVGSEIILNVFDTLVAWAPPRFDRLEGRLATTWAVSDDSTTFTFTIRPGVMFHDGTPCDASAVKAALERVKADNPFMTAYFGDIASIDAAGSDAVSIRLNKPSSVFLSYLAVPQAAIHSPTSAARWSKDQIGLHPVGTGPFMVESFTPDTEVTLTANPSYFRGAPALGRIVYRVLKDQATRRLELEAGSIDLVQQNGNLFSLPVADIAALKANPAIRVLEQDSQIVRYLQFNNTDSQIMKDVRVRRAIAQAVDYDNLVSGVLGDTASRVYGPLPQSSWAVHPNAAQLAPSYDPVSARQLLAEAGATGLNLQLYTFQGPSWRDIGTFLQANMAEVGINLQLVQMEFPPLRELITTGRHDIALGGRQPWYNDPDALLTIEFLSTLGPTALTARMPADPILDGLLLQAQSGTFEQRRQLYSTIQERLIDSVPTVSLFCPKIIIYTRANVQNVVPNSAPPLTEYFQVSKA